MGMARYIQPAVRELRNDPQAGEYVELILVPEEDNTDELRERVEAVGGEPTREITFGMLAIEIDQAALDELCDLAGLKSITLDEPMEVLESGNPNPDPASQN